VRIDDVRIATWNVNSLRVRLSQVLDWIAKHRPDALCVQETKTTDGVFPEAAFRDAGYRAIFVGQKTYNGVAIISRAPAQTVICDLPGVDSAQKRFLAATLEGVRIVNVYVPNGEQVGSEKFTYKLSWFEALQRYLASELVSYSKLVLLGDFNVAPEERDVHDPVRWEGQVLFSPKERGALAKVIDTGLRDIFRQFDQPEKSFTWWDYRQGGYRRNHGLRIDHILASNELAQKCRACFIDKEPRGWERPSDHVPVIADFDL
jgi:exodeoxyribonuclease-3